MTAPDIEAIEAQVGFLSPEPGPLPEGADVDYSGWRFLRWRDSIDRGRDLWMEYRKHLVRACNDRDDLKRQLTIATDRAARLEVAKCAAEREVIELRAIVEQYVPTKGDA